MKESGIAVSACLITVALAIGFDALLAAVLTWAWSIVAVPIFHLPPLTYWQAVAILIALWIIGGFFKGTSGSGK